MTQGSWNGLDEGPDFFCQRKRRRARRDAEDRRTRDEVERDASRANEEAIEEAKARAEEEKRAVIESNRISNGVVEV